VHIGLLLLAAREGVVLYVSERRTPYVENKLIGIYREY